MPKTITQIFVSAHDSIAKRQHRKYGNPLTEAPAHVGPALAAATQRGILTDEQARKLAMQLGRKSYGEIGLTTGVVGSVIDKVVGFGKLPWQVKAEMEHAIAA